MDKLNLSGNDTNGVCTRAKLKKKSNPYASNVNRIAEQIIRSVQDVIKVSKNNKFKQDSLNIVDAEDFEEFEYKTTKRLKSLLKSRRRKQENMVVQLNKNASEKSQSASTHNVDRFQFLQEKNSYSPIRKRVRKEPLTQLPTVLSQETTKEMNRDDKNKVIVDSINVTNLTQNCVDMSVLCDFIDGNNDQLDEWLETDKEFDKNFKMCENNSEKRSSPFSKEYKHQEALQNKGEISQNQEQKTISGFTTTLVSSSITDKGKLKDGLLETEEERKTGKNNSLLDCSSNNSIFKRTELLPTCLAGVHTIQNESDNRENQVVTILSQKILSEDWLEEYKHDEFWARLSPSPQDDYSLENFDLEGRDLFCVDENLIL
ncbi:uncharacterized protein LOC130640901 [Hydractinia symbiolongicarpus]|uniref:uncharacterized protein LOC130640901 n=1 Tax=Hydractinia symbiolongicarpus TaxID=13093 RepID=UPI00254A476B|nr:uncharacterized protein LOC130640901 [Hydractinia symbiolongicarpus]